jgi:hypothetical protein
LGFFSDGREIYGFVDLDVPGLINAAHPASAQLLNDFVASSENGPRRQAVCESFEGFREEEFTCLGQWGCARLAEPRIGRVLGLTLGTNDLFHISHPLGDNRLSGRLAKINLIFKERPDIIASQIISGRLINNVHLGEKEIRCDHCELLRNLS